MVKELSRYGIDIAAIAEVRFSDEDQLTEVGAGYTFFWKGRPAGERRIGGVGFLFALSWSIALSSHTESVTGSYTFGSHCRATVS